VVVVVLEPGAAPEVVVVVLELGAMPGPDVVVVLELEFELGTAPWSVVIVVLDPGVAPEVVVVLELLGIPPWPFIVVVLEELGAPFGPEVVVVLELEMGVPFWSVVVELEVVVPVWARPVCATRSDRRAAVTRPGAMSFFMDVIDFGIVNSDSRKVTPVPGRLPLGLTLLSLCEASGGPGP
jgi:hypothetical protein